MSKYAQSNPLAGRLSAVSVFGVYDSDDSKQRIEALLAHVAGNLHGSFQLNTILRRGDALGCVWHGDAINANAACADIMLVALEAGTQLKDELLRWLESWSTHRKVVDAALGLIMNGAVSSSSPIIEGLRLLAEHQGLTLLLSGDAVAVHAQEATRQRAQAQEWIAPFFIDVLNDIPQWDHSGLNE